MGTYIDSNKGYEAFKSIYNSQFFVDKSDIIHEFNKKINDCMNCICITKPRRFGKSSIAALIISYYSESRQDEFKKMFNTLKISGNAINKSTNHDKSSETPTMAKDKKTELNKIKEEYEKTQGKYNTIYIDFSEEIEKYDNVYEYISSIEEEIINELNNKFKKAYKIKSLLKYLQHLYNETHKKFIFVIDEWDSMFRDDLFSIDQKKYYLYYLKSLFKFQPYVAFAYMTGILPISKSNSSKSLNNFMEYTMLEDTLFYKYFGLTENEVRNLCEINGKLKYEDMENWYNGYRNYNGEKIFNIWSVISALRNNSFNKYWVNSGSKKELRKSIDFSLKGVKEEFLELIVKKKIKMKLTGYGVEDKQDSIENQNQNNLSQNGITNINIKKNEMYSKMVVFGLLTYYEEKIYIPNNELREKFIEIINEENDFKEFKNLMSVSEELFNKILNRKTDDVCAILKKFHMKHTPLKNYYSHVALSSTIYFAYYYARNKYYVIPEEEAGDGVADYIFKPKEGSNDIAIIIELKVGTSARDAINQIYNRQYYEKLFSNGYKGDILLVGINILRGKKIYTCIIEYFDKKKIEKINNNNNNNNDHNKRKRKQNQTNQMEYQTEYKKKLRSYNKQTD